MLPNFRRTDTEEPKLQPVSFANNSESAAPQKAIFSNRPATDRTAMSVIGADLKIAGNLISNGQVQVDGIVEGDVHGSNIVIGQTATIHGEIVADEVIVRGHVIGTIRSKRVMLQSTSEVDGDIYHQALSIEQGAMFEGKSRRTNDDPRTVNTDQRSAARRPAPSQSAAQESTNNAGASVVELQQPPRPPELPN